ncbi:uncharacterized protein LOC135199982 [Macrobrachium nipponense]|uniref:uncharacterized protein LOC135199982 n=1 Tax=Macrobrachium nipponense TaxID=159736 RepID=UPI0030C7C6E0
MNEKHRSLIKDLQTLLGEHRKLERVVEKRELTIQESIATGFSMLLMLMDSQSHLLEAKGLGEVLLSRQSAQGCQSAILGWYEPKLLDDTEEITISEGFQKGTMAAVTVLRHSMGLSFNQRVSDEASDFTSFTGNDQEELVMCVKHMMESPYWKAILEKTASDDTSDGNSVHRLAQGTRRIDTRLYDFDGRIYYSARSRFSRSRNVYVEKLVDISTGSTESSDVWYHKYRKPGVLAESGRVSAEPFSSSLLDEIVDDCYYQLRSEISKYASGAGGECLEGLTGKFKDPKQQGAFPKHMIPLTPTKERNELQLGLTRTETERDAIRNPKESSIKPLKAEGRDISKKETESRSMPATVGCAMEGRDLFSLATHSEGTKTDNTAYTTYLRPVTETFNTRTRTTKAVTLYPEWERGPVANASTDDHFKPLLYLYTKDGPVSGSVGAAVWTEQQDHFRGNESFGKSDKGACGEEQDTQNDKARKDEASEDTATFLKK